MVKRIIGRLLPMQYAYLQKVTYSILLFKVCLILQYQTLVIRNYFQDNWLIRVSANTTIDERVGVFIQWMGDRVPCDVEHVSVLLTVWHSEFPLTACSTILLWQCHTRKIESKNDGEELLVKVAPLLKECKKNVLDV